jgi:hypothetical protein
MLDWPNRTAPPDSAICACRFGDAHFENNAPTTRRWLADVPFICVSSGPDSEQPGARFRANHHRDVDGALGHPTCP